MTTTTATAPDAPTAAARDALPLLDRVRALQPLIDDHADKADEQRHLSNAVIDGLAAAGLLRIWLPEGLGGSETPLPEALEVFEALGRIDGSAGWIVALGSSAVMNYAAMDDEVFRAEFGGAAAGIAAVAAFPFQPAEAVEGGYRVSGRWQYASGSHHATRLAGGVIVMEDGQPRMTAAGRPEIRLLTFPRASVRILDTWHVTGLRGTGSADIKVDDLFVPERESFPLLSAERNASCHGVLYQLPLITTGALPMSAVALGIAQHAVDAFVELAATKAPALTETPLAERGAVQASFGAAAAARRAARAWHTEVAREVWAHTAWGEPVPIEVRLDAQLAGAHVTQTAVTVVEEMQRLAGASAIYETNPIERCFRDIHTLKQNAGVSHRNLEYAGGSLLGQPEANRLASF